MSLLNEYHRDMIVGHHTAYRLVVSALAKEISVKEALKELSAEKDDLNYCVAGYGLYCLLKAGYEADGRESETDGEAGNDITAASPEELLQGILSRNSVWPCISYLAAWNDAQRE